jgi:hypothetical protein
MRTRTWLALLFAVGMIATAPGCGGSEQQFAVNGTVLDVKDQLYVSRPMGYYCNTIAMGQIQIQLVDYGPACVLDRQQGAPDPRFPGIEHAELDIVLGVGGHPNNRIPYTLSKIDCQTMGDNGTAYLLHYPPNAMAPDRTLQVDSGTVVLTQYDVTNVKPVKGTFDLSFAGTELKGNLNALNCDPTS